MYRWISSDRLINRITEKDRLFGGKYILDPYQKCDISCAYCDAAEDIVYIKHNAMDLLRREIESLDRADIIIGSATDPYQSIEEKIQLTRDILDFLISRDYPVHILTKSDLIERDVDILKKGKVKVTLSLSTLDTNLSRLIEPNAPSPFRRIGTIKKLSEEDIETGVAIFPVIPLVTESHIDDMIRLSREAGARYLVYGYLELKGDLKKRFLHVMSEYSMDKVDELRKIYQDTYKPKGYSIDKMIRGLCKAHGLRI